MKLFLILILIVAFSIWYAKIKGISAKYQPTTLQIDTTLDSPEDFGYKMTWMAVKTDDKQGLAEQIGLHSVQATNWASGITNAYKNGIYITPQIGEWTLILGNTLIDSQDSNDFTELENLLNHLSKTYGEAQFFGTHRVVEYHHWMRSVNGEIQRAYAYIGESGETLQSTGNLTPVETELNLYNSLEEDPNPDAYYEDEYYEYPDEDFVMKMAEYWSVNPNQLSKRKDIKNELGLTGYLQ